MRRLPTGLGLTLHCLTVVIAFSAGAAETITQGQALIAESLALLERHVSISARLRHQSQLHGQTLNGSGNYWQLGTGAQRISRWEMQTQVAGKTASIVQVYDGDHLWTDRRLPSGRKVHRLDVARLQARLGSARPSLNRSGGNYLQVVAAAEGRGGLTQLLADSIRQFEFDPPRQTQLNGLAVSALIGRWRQRQLKALWPGATEQAHAQPQTWPEQLPHHVLILLGRDNLFPYVIEHRRSADAYLANTVAGLRPTRDPLLRYEIFEVQFATDIDQRLFEFKPGDVPWSDETTLVIERLREQRERIAKTSDNAIVQ